ncbi:polyprenyl synthetase family protein [Sphaerisporangium rhizosphaerae]|uniref:Polyprenyl synthetase family protein n=1 Tax=Sphaerisporangium rhizosphaerae TaxID=2269375 RepID=A0ABW2P6V9_9ACTN
MIESPVSTAPRTAATETRRTPAHAGMPVPRGVLHARLLLPPALTYCIDRLEPRLRDMCGYQLGVHDEHGHPTGSAHGKLIRPAFALLCAKACGGELVDAVPAAVAVELVHNASLVHDDIMDGDRERRHRPTVWARYGIPMAILAGDAMFALAFEALGTPERRPADHHLARTLRELMAGQSRDLRFERLGAPSIGECIDMIEGKTGALLGSACRLGALYGSAPTPVAEAFGRFGLDLGVAFQLLDDLLGIWGDPKATGKPVGSDLQARKKSAPVVAALTAGRAASRRLAELYQTSGPFETGQLVLAAELIDAAGGRAWAREEARRRIDAAWQHLAAVDIPGEARNDLEELTTFLIDREW